MLSNATASRAQSQQRKHEKVALGTGKGDGKTEFTEPLFVPGHK